MFLPDWIHKMLNLLNFAQKSLSFLPTPPWHSEEYSPMPPIPRFCNINTNNDSSVGGDQIWKSEYFERMIPEWWNTEKCMFSRVFSLRSSALYSPLSGVWYRLRLMYDCFHRPHHYYSPPLQNRVGTRIMRPNTFVTTCARRRSK